MIRALHHHFQMFHHMNVDAAYRKIEVLLPIHELMLYIIHILWQQKKLFLYTTLKERLALFKMLKAHYAQFPVQRKHLSLMLDYVGKFFTNNKPSLIVSKRNNCKPWIVVLQEKIRGGDGC